jgi:hypothetical protein
MASSAIEEGKNTNILNKKKHQSKRKWRNPKRGPMSKSETSPKCEREEKALTQIPSLGPKPLASHVKQIRRREGRNLK